MAKSDKEKSNKDKFVATGEGVTIYDKNGKPITPKSKSEKKANDKETRIALIKLAHSHPKGSNERKSVLAALTQFLPTVVEYKGFRWNDFGVVSENFDDTFDDGGAEENARRDKALKILSRALATVNLKDVIKKSLMPKYTVLSTIGVHTVDGVGFKVPSSVVSSVETELMDLGWTPSREAMISRTALTHPDIDQWIVLCGFREGFVGFIPK
jgi:hypothetical protein